MAIQKIHIFKKGSLFYEKRTDLNFCPHLSLDARHLPTVAILCLPVQNLFCCLEPLFAIYRMQRRGYSTREHLNLVPKGNDPVNEVGDISQKLLLSTRGIRVFKLFQRLDLTRIALHAYQ